VILRIPEEKIIIFHLAPYRKAVQAFSCVILLALPVLESFAEEILIFTAPPRESVEKGKKTYGQIADYLSKVLGVKVVYKHPGNWLTYSEDMRNEKYDIVFDGPHFVSWRIKNINHTPVIKIPGGFVFKFVAFRGNEKISKVDDLIGRRVCGHAPPNQGTLRLYNEFKNPMRLPILVPKKGWRNIYTAMLDGECDAAILPEKIYKKVDPQGSNSKVLFSSRPVSGQAITVSRRFDSKAINNIRRALLSESGQLATKNLRARFASPTLVPATKQEYAREFELLAETYGFGIQF